MTGIFNFSDCGAEHEVDAIGSNYNDRERALRLRFVSEYLVDFDQTAACLRLGFYRDQAIEYAKKLMEEPYVAREISRAMTRDYGNSSDEQAYNKARIQSQLFREANYKGPGSSQAARVAALKQLAVMHGMDAPAKTENVHRIQGGVMAVPAITDLDSWEQAAVKSQEDLTKANDA